MVATAIASRSMKPAVAIGLVTIFTFIAPFTVGLAVADTVGTFVDISAATPLTGESVVIAALLSALVQKWEDFIIILIMLLVNAGLDFFQEHRALNALKTLKAKMDRQVTILREGTFKRIPARELVPGDLIKMRIGDVVPADVQLLSGDYLLIDQAALTGESLPVSRKINEIAYANTIVKQGEMLAVVVNTGINTHFSTVVSLVAKAQLEERSHFQKMVIQIGNLFNSDHHCAGIADHHGIAFPSRRFH